MKILIYGAGVIGCTYGWLLSEAGYDVTVLVRQGKKQDIEKNGIDICCDDFRGGLKQNKRVVFRPPTIDGLSSTNDFEYIVVSLNCIHLKEAISDLSKSAGKAHILFFQNIWNDFDEIAKYLSPGQYFFGFPFMVGGGRSEGCINSIISGLKYSCTPLGEVNGEITPRLQIIAKILADAGLKPVFFNNMKVWLITHYAVAAALSAGIMSAGSGKVFAANSKIVKETIKSIREGFNICRKKGVDPKLEKSNRLYYLPLFLSVLIAKRIYKSEELCLMFDGHIQHSPEEMRQMLIDVMADGKVYDVNMRCLENLKMKIF